MKPSYKKSLTGDLLMWSDLALGPSFKVKLGYPNINVLITRLLLVLEVHNAKQRNRIMGLESFDVHRFNLGPLLIYLFTYY